MFYSTKRIIEQSFVLANMDNARVIKNGPLPIRVYSKAELYHSRMYVTLKFLTIMSSN